MKKMKKIKTNTFLTERHFANKLQLNLLNKMDGVREIVIVKFSCHLTK